MYDYIFRNATIIDGTGKPRFNANVAVFGGNIAFLGAEPITRGKYVIDCTGKILCPGFVDMHCHSDLETLRERSAKVRLGQGITTDVSGNCGFGTFPNSPYLPAAVADVLGEYSHWEWSDYSSWKEYVQTGGIGVNQVYLVAHSALRLCAMGEDSSRVATEEEIARMCEYLDNSLSSGAYGLSSGLYYAPCTYASKDELLALLSVVKKHDKLFSVHHRCEGNEVVSSLNEILELALESGVRVEVSHLKAIGDINQSKVDRVRAMIDEYKEKGVDIGFDQYPYSFGSTSLFSLLPPSILAFSRYEQRLALALENERSELKKEILSPSGWDSVYQMVGPDKINAIYLETHPEFNGKSLTEIGAIYGKDPLDALFTLLSEETGLAVMEDVTTTEENLKKIMKHSLMCFGSDSLYSSPIPHPRSYHATVEFLAKYIRDEKVLSLEEGIRRMTLAPCRRLNINRGIIKEGFPADIVVLDLEQLKANGDFSNIGFDYVLVIGSAAVAEGKFTDIKEGKVL